ncbi:MAG: BlaI/MecI/CopY family transcriptional regulator [Verrucomicrobiae bacterium]|nr:BlaI/MecI/CopY family transcriptional regulator [Verrucomicrobiae bacterium]
MEKKSPPKPTEAELELLQVLWRRGPSTVREIHEALSVSKSTGYTTTLKILQKMTDKGLVRRDESNRSHVYEALAQAAQTERQLAGELLRKAFGDSPARLMVAALDSKKATPQELAEIRRLLDDIEAKTPMKQ